MNDANENNVIDIKILLKKLKKRKFNEETIQSICVCSDYIAVLESEFKKLAVKYTRNKGLVESGFIFPQMNFQDFIKSWDYFTATILEETR